MGENFFRILAPEVTFEDFGSEILIIDLKTGHYHSVRGSGVHLWRLLNAGQSMESCAEKMKQFYRTDATQIENDTNHFLLELEQAGLIARLPQGGIPTEAALEGPREEYGKPTIDSYGDLQDLLLLDPIHEIAPEAGWPKRREEA